MKAKALATALAALATACPFAGAQEPVTEGQSALAVMSGEQALALGVDFYTVVPFRALDTRTGVPLASGSTRTFQIAGMCGVPTTANTVAVNVAVTGPTASGFVKLWPADLPEPATSTINFGPAVTRTNNALVSLATDGSGAISAKAFLADSGSVHLILDVTGYMAGARCPAGSLFITGVSPYSGSIGTAVTISGQGFAPNVQVLFGEVTTGSTAPLLSSSSVSIIARVPLPPPGFTFDTGACDANGDGIPSGRWNIPTLISINVRNLETGCVATLLNSFVLNPSNTVCEGDDSMP